MESKIKEWETNPENPMVKEWTSELVLKHKLMASFSTWTAEYFDTLPKSVQEKYRVSVYPKGAVMPTLAEQILNTDETWSDFSRVVDSAYSHRNAAINTAEYYRFIDTQRSEDTQQPEEPSLRTRSRSERKRQTVITKDGKFELRKIWPDAKVIPQSGLQAPPSTVTIKSFFKKLVDVVMHFLKMDVMKRRPGSDASSDATFRAAGRTKFDGAKGVSAGALTFLLGEDHCCFGW